METNVVSIKKVLNYEGKLKGKPVGYLRFKGCPMRCQFGDSICNDSSLSFFADKNKAKSLNESHLLDFLERNPNIDSVVLSGGSPSEDPNFEKICIFFQEIGIYVIWETAGFNLFSSANFLSLSPKLDNSVPGAKYNVSGKDLAQHKLHINKYRRYAELILSHSDYDMKFVIARKKDFELVTHCLQETAKEICKLKPNRNWARVERNLAKNTYILPAKEELKNMVVNHILDEGEFNLGV